MTSAREVKRLVSPLLDRQPDIALVQHRFLLVNPLRHVLRCVCIDRTSDKDQFRPSWATVHLFEGLDYLPVGPNGGGMIPLRSKRGLWRLDTPGMDEEFRHQVETEILPHLRNIDTIADYVAHADHLSRWDDPLAHSGRRLFVHVALGEIAEARVLCAKDAATWTRKGWDDLRASADNWTRMADLVLADDRAGMIALLHEREALSVGALGLGAIWQRTPFPLETMG